MRQAIPKVDHAILDNESQNANTNAGKLCFGDKFLQITLLKICKITKKRNVKTLSFLLKISDYV